MSTKPSQHCRIAWALLAATVTLLSVAPVLAAGGEPTGKSLEFTDVRAQTQDFIRYNHSIHLTAKQEAIKKEALGRLRAPCCDDNSAYTCCCECNLRRTSWGLASYLIAEKDFSSAEVTQKVAEWFAFINPDGFSGEACYEGGCMRAFRDNGCGGMQEAHLVF